MRAFVELDTEIPNGSYWGDCLESDSYRELVVTQFFVHMRTGSTGPDDFHLVSIELFEQCDRRDTVLPCFVAKVSTIKSFNSVELLFSGKRN